MLTTHIDRVDLNLLPPLVALLEERHVSRAADRLALSQPAMSRALQRLRRHFGDELLVRGPDGYSLTPRAERIRDQLATVVTELDQLFANETFDPATTPQSFRLAVSDYTVAAFGPALVRRILRQSPNSTVICEALDARVFDKLDAGTLDLAIYGRAAPERYSSQHLFTDRFVCVVAAEHPLTARTSVSLSQYLRWPHLSIDVGRPWVDLALESRGATRRVAVVLPYHVVGSSILPGTDLVLTVPARLVSQFADSSRVRVLHAPRELGDVQFYTVWHPRLDSDPAHSWLRGIVRDVAGPASRRRTAAKSNADS
ncbi:LysR family transcriptional regulator [Mycobacterium montefiorense]|uniref:LysR family transcriptional regulator n=1 Tax=Mycobacterium montefiorense TaxID=154654 RepID=A0AA37PNV7_9MYCO|nr:LysR family transcriptional regulator [Mycobacterium montefiorense]GBG37788.1 LysR family transcriptional regulator [Mycobacterium montefiorense]GKU34926.1 LysR family transcriptional regulator [Mycobacterium montefiorense]GKU40939.1 LysR family transcriptional regulator [Mycobacterium montefiorense]GKU47048.1 LysR family transcriptional regulator [Mycobacterium montefiorense]GKU49168.1 LysR family transcriptional regulator [Mycobacterium montefiorense]